MYKLIHFECENFIGLFNGLNKKKVVFDLNEYRDKSIFIFLGGNARGKSTLLSILHPFSSTTDKRDKFIRKGKEGYKQLLYEKQGEEDVQLKIRHVYIPNKTGHSTKSYIHKIVNGKEVDLNPNGNVSSFLLAIEQEFGITEDFLRLSAQNEEMQGLVNMTGANRKDHLYKFIPKSDDTTVYQRIVARKYRDVKIYLSSIVDKLGKMEDEVTVQERLRDIERATNKLVEKRDKLIGKINKGKSEIQSLDPDDKLMNTYREIRSQLKDLNDKQGKSQDRLNRLLGSNPNFKDISIENIDPVVTKVTSDKLSTREEIVTVSAELSSKRQLRSSLYDSIVEKETVIKQLSGTKSKEDIKQLLKEYKDKIDSYDKRSRNLNTSLTADDLIRGIDVLETLRTYLFDIYNNADSKPILEMACDAAFSNKFEKRYNLTKEALEKVKDRMSNLTNNINSLNSYEHLKDGINKRPSDCVIDTCGFLQDYQKWVGIEKRIKELQTQLDGLNDDHTNLFKEMERLTEAHNIKTKVEAAIMFYRSNLSLISKLPFNDKYSTEDKLIKRILDYDTLVGVENNFYDIIEILQEKGEYDEIKNVKIPLLTNELKSLSDNDDIVESIKSDIDKLNSKYEKEVLEIEKYEEKLNLLEEKMGELSKEEEFLLEVKERLTKMEEAKKDIIQLSNTFDEIKDKSERINKLMTKQDERRQKLKLIESKLKPLTTQRDSYKYQEIKIQEYKVEKEILEENLQILHLIRDALSTNKGMVVDIIKMYVDEMRRGANLLLSETFDGTLYLEKFVINDKEFTIPFQHNGDRGPDISDASSSEKSFISTCLSMSIIEQIISNYGVLTLDETDRGFSSQNKAIYCTILMKQIRRIGINQCFMVTHSREYYEPYDVAYVLFPGHDLNTKDKDCIYMY